MTIELFIWSFAYSLFATVIGGGILAFLFFWLREKVSPLPVVTGRWYFEMHTVKTAYRPFEGMRLRYVAMLLREGNRIAGTVEKIYENVSGGERWYEGKNRTRGIVEGFIEKRYFSKDRVTLHVVEAGHERESTNFHDLVVESNEQMRGRFTSTVADQDGGATWQRREF